MMAPTLLSLSRGEVLSEALTVTPTRTETSKVRFPVGQTAFLLVTFIFLLQFCKQARWQSSWGLAAPPQGQQPGQAPASMSPQSAPQTPPQPSG